MYLLQCITGRDGNVIVRQAVGVAETQELAMKRAIADSSIVQKRSGGLMEIKENMVRLLDCRNGLSYGWTIEKVDKII